MSKRLTIIPFGGLGNRLRVLNSAIYFSKEIDSEIELIWFKKAELFADFQQIFDGVGANLKITKGIKYKILKLTTKHIYVQKYEKLFRLVFRLFYDEVLFDSDISGTTYKEIFKRINNGKSVLIATCYQFYGFPNFNNFTVKKMLREEIDSFGIDENYVGIHIRMTDHSEIMNESPLENYKRKMLESLEINPQTKFYLSSDDDSVKERLNNEFGERIKVQEVPLERSSIEGIFGAIIDVYNLSRCSAIICNPKSSFAIMASQIGNPKPLIIV
ncbi:MAG: hypothetical protein U0V04_08165 [Spirosomataceae bacterium]|jgi:hypothetical protein